MRHRSLAASAALASLASLALACADPGASTAPRQATPGNPSLEVGRATSAERRIQIFDLCEPNSFNAAVGPGTCVRKDGGVAFSQFLEQIGRLGRAPGWRFDPVNAEIAVGTTLVAQNRGGEVHTFTEVEEFGGGINETLNRLSGNPNVAPECRTLAATDFIAPGGTQREKEEDVGTERYQCCIHPWMRMTVHIRARS